MKDNKMEQKSSKTYRLNNTNSKTININNKIERPTKQNICKTKSIAPYFIRNDFKMRQLL